MARRSGTGRPGSLSAEAIATARWLAAELRTAGYQPALQPIAAAPDQSNVIATYEGSTPGKTVVVMAHYDHLGTRGGELHPGANDNASGVVVALAVARDLVARRDVPGRVVFLFTGAEELGLLGAKAYVAAPTIPLDQIRLVVNLDMVGRRFFESVANKPDTIAAVGLDEATALLAQEAAKVAGLELPTFSPVMLSAIGQSARSDDWVFRDRGVLAVHLSSGLDDDYHRATDTAEKLAKGQLVKVATLVRDLVARTAR